MASERTITCIDASPLLHNGAKYFPTSHRQPVDTPLVQLDCSLQVTLASDKVLATHGHGQEVRGGGGEGEGWMGGETCQQMAYERRKSKIGGIPGNQTTLLGPHERFSRSHRATWIGSCSVGSKKLTSLRYSGSKNCSTNDNYLSFPFLKWGWFLEHLCLFSSHFMGLLDHTRSECNRFLCPLATTVD